MTYEFYAAGVKFHQYPRVKHLIKEEDEVLLVPEPDNQYDPHAVKVMYQVKNDFIMLGHVPMKKDLSKNIFMQIKDSISPAKGIITYHGLDSPSYQALKVKVSFDG